MADRIQLRRDTAANWTQYNPILLEGEPGIELDTDQWKLGDGIHTWSQLAYRGGEYVQQRGQSTTVAMSQKAVSDVFDLFSDFLGNKTGYDLKNVGFVRYTTGVLESGGYMTSDFIKVEAGDVIKITNYCSTTVAVVSAYSTNNESSYIQASSLKGDNSSGDVREYVVPSGVNYVRFSCSGDSSSSSNVKNFRASVGLASQVDKILKYLNNPDVKPIIDSDKYIKSGGVMNGIQNYNSFGCSYNIFNKDYVRYGKAVNNSGAIIDHTSENVATTLYYYIPKDCKKVVFKGYDTTGDGLRIRLCEEPNDSSRGICVSSNFDPSQYPDYHYFCVFIARTALSEEINFSGCSIYFFNQWRNILDVSLFNKSNGVLPTYSSFSNVISAIPTIFKQDGGLEIMYLNTNNKYERRILLKKDWSDNEEDWLNLNSVYEDVYGNNSNITSSSLTNVGHVAWGTGKLTTSGYHTTEFIKVNAGDKLVMYANASESVAAISAYSSTDESSYIQASSVRGTNIVGLYRYTVPSGVNYIRCSCHDNNRNDFLATIIDTIALKYRVDSLYNSKKDDLIPEDKGLITNNAVSVIKGLLIKDRIKFDKLEYGYIKPDGTISYTGDYKYSDFIAVSAGEELILFTPYFSGGVAHIAAYTTNDDSAYSRDNSIIGNHTSNRIIEYTVPNGITYIRVTMNTQGGTCGYLCKKSDYIKAIEDRAKTYNYGEIILSCPVGDGSLILTNVGWVGYSDGVLQSSGYHTTGFIRVNPGNIVRTISKGSTTVAAISAYSSTDESSYIQASSVQGGGEGREIQYKVPYGVFYLRFTCSDGNISSFYVFIHDSDNLNDRLKSLKGDIVGNILTDYIPNVGHVAWGTGKLTTSGYHTTEFIKVNAGDKLVMYANASESVAAISAYSSTDESSYIQASSVRGTNIVGLYRYTVPSGVNYIRCSCHDSYKDLFYISYDDGLDKRVSDIEEKLEVDIKDIPINFKQPTYNLVKSRCSINFSFDDGPSQDVDIKAVFDEFNKKCGFAIYSSNQRYKQYAEEGFEILAHNTNKLSDKDEAYIRNSMVQGKGYVEALGLICHGWVTPSSALPSSLRYVTNDYFEYGFTVYKGVSPSGQTMDSTMKSYDLWRVHMDTLIALNTDTESPYYNQPNYVSILADAKQNNGMISVYAHGHELAQQGWTLNDLRTILQYCITNGIEILTPYESCLKLFEERHN